MQTSWQRWLRRIGWIETFDHTWNLPPSEVAEHLRQHTDAGHDPGLFEVFATGLKPYTGEVRADGFVLRRRRKLFDWNTGMARITGTLRPQGAGTRMTTTIGFPAFLSAIIVGVFVVFYGLVAAMLSLGVFGSEARFILPFVLLQSIVLALIFYLVFRQEIRVSRRYFEQDFGHDK
jgi:hypothetical protein